MKKSALILTACGVWGAGLLCLATPGFAGDSAEKNTSKTVAVTHRNEQYDLNKDGKLDELERAAMKADRAAKRHARQLAKYDANKNGQLDVEEQAKCDADREMRRLKAAERRKAKAAEKAAIAATPPPPAAVPLEDEDDDAEAAKS
ncbi:MAG: hypothetical protein IPL39_03850 [Opitutaceae bacterium]|nr:hypothetical protein [Opitutaceae bacterium]